MFRYSPVILLTCFVLLSIGGYAIADQPITTAEAVVVEAETPEFVPADIAWMLISSALVLMMTAPGLALFYGGWCARKT